MTPADVYFGRAGEKGHASWPSAPRRVVGGESQWGMEAI